MTLHFAVMGDPIAHSLSPIIHQEFARQFDINISYEKIQIDLPHFEQQVMNFFNQGGMGLNITLPCKQRAFDMSDKPSQRCLAAKAANTLWKKSEDLYADNTDGIGLIRDLGHYLQLEGKSILLLGAGGAARGIIGPLLAENTAVTIANRTQETALILQKDFPPVTISSFENLNNQYFDIVINATSASLDNQNMGLPHSLLKTKPFCYDLAYAQNQATPFVDWAQTAGCEAVDGLGMLIEQAAEAFYIWHQVMPNIKSILNLFGRSTTHL